jgi:hypothetical protein
MPEKLLALLGPRESKQFSNTLFGRCNGNVTLPHIASRVRDQIITIVTFTFIGAGVIECSIRKTAQKYYENTTAYQMVK